MSDHPDHPETPDPLAPIREVIRLLDEQARPLGLQIVAPPQLVFDYETRHPDAITLTFSVDPEMVGAKAAEIAAQLAIDREVAEWSQNFEREQLEEGRRSQKETAEAQFEAVRQMLAEQAAAAPQAEDDGDE